LLKVVFCLISFFLQAKRKKKKTESVRKNNQGFGKKV